MAGLITKFARNTSLRQLKTSISGLRTLSSEASIKQVPSKNSISALVAIITDASKVVEAHYERAKLASPSASGNHEAVPSLDTTESHPLDGQISSLELRTAIQTIEGACAQLSATVARPNHTMVNKFMGYFEAVCINIALKFKIADLLQEKPEGMHISEIGERTGVEELKIGRVLRLLATKHVFREVSENVFANNRLSIQLVSGNPMSSLGLHFSDEGVKVNVLLPDVLEDPDWGHSYSSSRTAFNKYTGYPGSMFDYYQNDKPKGALSGARLGLGMVGWGTACEDHAVITEFPWKELGDGATVCDVGAGVGNITMQLAKAYPSLQLILQDLPERVKQAREDVWPRKCPEAIEQGRIKFVPIDFFSGPPIPGCNIYYLKNVIHNWSDADVIKIFSNVRAAMAPHSRVLIQDYILQPASRLTETSDGNSQITQAPEPLLPNFGSGRIRQYNLDIHMMTILNSEERRLSDFIRLGEAAGLKFVKFWDIGDTGLVEYKLL
ncbi:S-adenosyl-L-methionine-dependent methyltransferase [Agrocybe pediades]|nr:S-adenosyl-L-methionine-dependent methyltransferase [Agrocybe pediades]